MEAVCHYDGQLSVEWRDSAVPVPISHPTPGPFNVGASSWQQNTVITGYRLATEYSYYRIQTSLHGLHVMCNVQVPSTLRPAVGNGKSLLQGANLQQNTFITGCTGCKLAIEHLHYRIQAGNRTDLLQDTNWQQNTHLHCRTQTATEHLYYKT